MEFEVTHASLSENGQEIWVDVNCVRERTGRMGN